MFHFHDFANLSTMKRHYVASPKFTCNGHQWELWVFPGGSGSAEEGYVSVFLKHLSYEAITIRIDINVIDKFGKTNTDLTSTELEYACAGNYVGLGWNDFTSRSDILDESNKILDDNGTLTVVVYIEEVEESTDIFVPKNPFANILEEMLNDEATADICFEVSAAEKK